MVCDGENFATGPREWSTSVVHGPGPRTWGPRFVVSPLLQVVQFLLCKQKLFCACRAILKVYYMKYFLIVLAGNC